MKNQIELFDMADVPKGPTGQSRLKTFKSRNHILTHSIPADDAGGMNEAKWLACFIPSKRLDNGKPIAGMSLSDMMLNFCGLLDEGGYTGYGPTERAAVIEACQNRGVACDL